MKILYTGGGSGGHFYPIIAVAEEVNRQIEAQKLIGIEQYFMSDSPYDERALFENGIAFKKIEAGKMRTYFSILNFFDIFKTAFGILRSVFKMFALYPDVIFSKGGYAAFPPLLAARLFRIPVIIHESDTVPGRVNKWAGKFAERVAISFPESAIYFPKDKTALIGIPIRKALLSPVTQGAHEFLHLDPSVPTIMIIGGSQGCELINETVIDILPSLVSKYQIIHQVGRANYESARGRADVALRGNPNIHRYKVFDTLNETALRMTAGVAKIAISRAGATSIFELATWKMPSIIIPITDSHGDHQRKNAYSYARTGAAIIIEEKNLAPHLLESEINRLMDAEDERNKMSRAAGQFAIPGAAEKIANELLAITLSHQ